jgi:hypothetical protein
MVLLAELDQLFFIESNLCSHAALPLTFLMGAKGAMKN